MITALGQKVIDLKSAKNGSSSEYSLLDIMKMNDDYFEDEEYSPSDELQSPLSVESEEVIAVWIME